MHKHSLAALALVALLGGCPTTVTCPAGSTFVAGVCIVQDGGTMTDTPPELDAPEGSDAGPCNGACDGTATPFCDTTSNECVECLTPTDCEAEELACIEGVCEQCETNAECTTAELSVCNTTSHTCEACTGATGCGHDGLGAICDTSGGDGVCVECTVATEATDCGLNSCDPATQECTTTPRTSVRRCGACVADSECMNTDDRCVEMQFDGAAHGSYCLKQADTGCVSPFASPTAARPSTSGAVAEIYCGVPEASTTCEAVLDLVDNTTCTMASDCGADGLDDGVCGTVNFIANRCSYPCEMASQCTAATDCMRMMFCGAN